MWGQTRIIPLCERRRGGADTPASVVVQARYTQSDRETGEPDLNASALGKSEEISVNWKRSSITERRNHISPSKLRHLVFLNGNLHKVGGCSNVGFCLIGLLHLATCSSQHHTICSLYTLGKEPLCIPDTSLAIIRWYAQVSGIQALWWMAPQIHTPLPFPIHQLDFVFLPGSFLNKIIPKMNDWAACSIVVMVHDWDL